MGLSGEDGVPRAGYRGKRALDLTLTLLTAPLWLPLLAITALLVGIRIGRPILFTQERPGLNGRLFRLVKFRTMIDARGSDGRLLPDGERLTRFGNTLRATSLDELPELWNVLIGDMSLVGPRPLLPQYLPLYSARQRRRHEVRPGVTGLAQVSGRNASSWDERLELDVRYVERASLALDLSILISTVSAVLTRRGISAAGHATMPAFTGALPRASEPASREPPRSPDPDPHQ